MRIAIATTSYPSEPGDPSGHFVQAHARGLARSGAEVVVFAPGMSRHGSLSDFGEPCGSGRLRVVRLGGAALLSWPGAAARAREQPLRLALVPLVAARASRAIRVEGSRERFDRTIAHWIPCAALFAGGDAPLLVVAHGADVRLLLRAPGRVRADVVRRLLARDARIQFVATALRDDLRAALPPGLGDALAGRSFVEAAPFELPKADTLGDPRADLGLRQDAPYVAWLGRLVPDKRPWLAMEAARLCGTTLVIVGDGPLYDGIATASSGSQVVFAGRLPRDRAIAVMSRASAVLHTSAKEGASTVVREARALGVPVVACASGDLEIWARHDDGISIADADAPAIARALARAFTSVRSVAHHGGPS